MKSAAMLLPLAAATSGAPPPLISGKITAAGGTTTKGITLSSSSFSSSFPSSGTQQKLSDFSPPPLILWIFNRFISLSSFFPPHCPGVLLRNALVEAVTAFMMMFAGCCLSIQTALSGGAFGGYLQLCLGWAIIVTVLVYAALNTSGALLSPAITFTFLVLGVLPPSTFFSYTVAHFLGYYAALVACTGLYADALRNFTGGVYQLTGAPNATGSLFVSFPPEHVSTGTAFLDGVIGTAFLLFCVCALTDARNGLPRLLFPPLMGGVVALICSAFALNTGTSINPGSALVGRLFLEVSGYGPGAFLFRSQWFWLVPVLSPLCGGPLGALFYHLTIGLVLHQQQQEQTVGKLGGFGGSSSTTSPSTGTRTTSVESLCRTVSDPKKDKIKKNIPGVAPDANKMKEFPDNKSEKSPGTISKKSSGIVPRKVFVLKNPGANCYGSGLLQYPSLPGTVPDTVRQYEGGCIP